MRGLLQPVYGLIAAVAIGWLGSCAAFWWTGSFHLRLVVEGVAASILVSLALQNCLRTDRLIYVLAFSLLGVVFVILGCRAVLGDAYPNWLENSIWYLPVAAGIGFGMRVSGYRFATDLGVQAVGKSYSIGALMIITGIVAAAFPTVSFLARMRTTDAVYPTLWLFDSLTLVVPITAVCCLAFVAGALSRWIYLSVLLLVAPAMGFAICRIYDWDHYQSIVGVIWIATAFSGLIGLAMKRMGYHLVSLPYREAGTTASG